MASKSLGTLTLDLIAKIGGFTGPLDKADRKTTEFAKSVSSAGKVLGTAIGAGAVAAAAGIVLVVNKQRELIDQQAKVAQQLDTTYASISNLERAGDLGGVGMDKITAASRMLNLNIGKAIQGTDLQVEAFARLGLSAQDIYDLPLDERISTINKALTDNVQASERAAVAADIYGAKSAKAMQLLDPGTIAEAARQVEIFGLNLSEIDSTKVEMANDAMSTFGLLSDGVAKQLTVELAPILQGIGDEFLRSAEEAGGLGTVVQDVVGDVVTALGFVANAADGVGRVFTVVANTIVARFASAEAAILGTMADINAAADSIPGVDLTINVEKLRASAALAESVVDQSLEAINDAFNEPLAGDQFKAFYAESQQAADKAAEAAVASRKEALKTGEVFVAEEDKKTKAAKTTKDAIESQIASLQLQAETLGMTSQQATLYKLALDGATESQLASANAALEQVDAFEKSQTALEEHKQLVEEISAIQQSTWSDASKALQEYQDKVETLRKGLNSGAISQDSYDSTVAALDEQAAKAQETTDQMSEYAKSAAQNMQSAFADFLFDPFEGGLDGMLQSFGTILQRMIAEAAAAQLFESLGSFGTANADAGGATGLLAGIASIFGGDRATGGAANAGSYYQVGENNQPEIFESNGKSYLIPGSDGRVVPINSGSSNKNQTFNISLPNVTSGREAREAGASVRRSIAQGVAQAARYN